MVLYKSKNLLATKDILKTLPSSGNNKYIKILQRQPSRKTVVKELGKMELNKVVLTKISSSAVFLELCLWYKNIDK